ncbi:MAG TPA: preprotein translocase subunit SecG [Bacteroidia bacterium]|nr:preprotein translocase subunit SecG [Bacteroidia bacterium]
MNTLIEVLISIVSVVLILVVLVQNSKGGGLSSSFASSNQVMGVRKTTDFLEKATWALAIALLALSLISVPLSSNSSTDNSDAAPQESVTKKKADEMGNANAFQNNAIPTPAAAQAPAEGTKKEAPAKDKKK